MSHAGELAALGTALCWACGFNFFAAAGQRMGSVVLNRLRLLIAMVLLALALLVTRGTPWPTWATSFQIGVLALSGLIGFVFGDTFNFKAIVILGPGRGALLAGTAPVFTALLAWPILGEHLGPLAALGMALTLGGVMIVRYRRNGETASHPEGSVAAGVMAGILGAVGQAGGYVLSKIALRTGLDPLSATVIRAVAATIAIWLVTFATGEARPTVAALGDRRASLLMVAGAVCGPFLGVTLSLVALRSIPAGVAASITSIHPLLAMVIASRFHDERLTWRTLAGAVLAITGIVVLFRR